MSTTTTAPHPGEDRRFLGHPMGLANLFTTEFWERASYYGMRAILVYYLIDQVSGLKMDDGTAKILVSVYGALVYLLPIPGAWVGDRLLGFRTATLISGIVITSGHVVLATSGGEGTLYAGLLLIALGSGLQKPNISAMVGQLYRKDDPRRDGGYTLFYWAINCGAFISPLLVGAVAKWWGWHAGFSVAGIGMGIALFAYVAGWKWLGEIGKQVPDRLTGRQRPLAALGAVVITGVLAALLWWDISTSGKVNVDHIHLGTTVINIVVSVGYFVYLYRNVAPEYRSKLTAFLGLFLVACLYWAPYNQQESSLAVFGEKSLDLTVLGWEFPASWLQSVNPLTIIILAPLIAMLWTKLGSRNPSTAVKYVYAIVLIGTSFLIMGFTSWLAEGGQKVSFLWMILVLVVLTIGEIASYPISLSVTSKLADPRYGAQMQALNLLTISNAYTITGFILEAQEPLGDPVYFSVVGLATVLLGVVFLLFAVKPLRRLMGDVH